MLILFKSQAESKLGAFRKHLRGGKVVNSKVVGVYLLAVFRVLSYSRREIDRWMDIIDRLKNIFNIY